MCYLILAHSEHAVSEAGEAASGAAGGDADETKEEVSRHVIVLCKHFQRNMFEVHPNYTCYNDFWCLICTILNTQH